MSAGEGGLTDPPAPADTRAADVVKADQRSPGSTSKKNPPIDSQRQVQAKIRLEQTKGELQAASREKASAEQKLPAAQARVAAVTSRLRAVPPSLQSARRAMLQERDLNRRLELVNETRASRRDWSPDEKAWLDQQAELLDAQLDLEAASFGRQKQGENVRDATILEPVRQQELARASKSVADLIRSDGRNYRALTRTGKFDEVMGEKAWIAQNASRPKGAPPLELNTDHIVSVREIRDEVVKSGLLELHAKASPAVKEQIERAIQDLGDERANLARMEKVANQTWKSDRSWENIYYEKVASLYTPEMVDAMRAREAALREHYKQLINGLVARFSKRQESGEMSAFEHPSPRLTAASQDRRRARGSSSRS